MHEVLTMKSNIPSITITMPDDLQAIAELRTLRKKAEKSAKEIGQELLKWQKDLGRGKFKAAFMAAGWAESSVYYYIKQARTDQTPVLESQPVAPEAEESNGGVVIHEEVVAATEAEDSDEQDADTMPDNPHAKQQKKVSRRFSSLGYGPVEVFESDLSDEYEVVFRMSFEAVERLYQKLSE
jgi:hypothetical protein